MKKLKNNIYLKVFSIVVIALLLLIPTSMIRTLIDEREFIQQDAIREVSMKWSEAQTIRGPILSIPYVKYIKEISRKDSSERVTQITEYMHILPSDLVIQGNIDPEKRYRGIYEIVVYQSKIKLSGFFENLDIASHGIPSNNIQFEQAEFVLGLDDLRGIAEQVKLSWNQEEVAFEPGVSSDDIVSSGISASLSLDPGDSTRYNFQLTLDLKGSQRLFFTPVGKVTNISITSAWKNPSFNGAYLPVKREVSENGFTADWKVLHLNRNYPQSWTGSRYSLSPSSFGIDLLLPVDSYQKSYRSIRYAILFIGFTFLVFFFIEVMNRVFIHPVQYILVGVALVVFYTLLLSISEHLTFNLAYIISALATLLLIGGYVKAMLKSSHFTLLISSILAILYVFIFVIIQLQDYALLIGSLGIFIILGLVMYLSRKIDWYNLSVNKEKDQ